jgi:uncharacterized protein (TIGR00661 family)
MFFYNSDNNYAKKTILIAPLDWGLGHAARCIPIITELNESGHNVIIAAEGPVKELLQQEFPRNLFVPLEGYKIKYSKSAFWLPAKLLIQLPQILLIINKEHSWLKKVVREYKIEMVVSDNRFGLFHKTVPSVYITHQLFIKTGNLFSEKMAQRIHRWIIEKFTECWVPDFETENAIAGELSHPAKGSANVKYIGCLSRFKKVEHREKENKLLILLSGPEPQRTIFENLLLRQVENFKGKIILVRGLPCNINTAPVHSHKTDFIFKNHLPAQELCNVIQQSELVLCRSGYTTVMDLIKLQQKAILVPTPGQTEQEYLATYLYSKNIFYSVPQQSFDLLSAIKKSEQFSYKIPEVDMQLFKKVVHEIIEKLP